MTIASSLFEPTATPVLPSAAAWLTGTVFGEVAVALCVIAVAAMGMLLMMGRLGVRDAARIVIGCFVLLGAPVIAAGLRTTAGETAAVTVQHSYAAPAFTLPVDGVP